MNVPLTTMESQKADVLIINAVQDKINGITNIFSVF